MFLKVLEKSVEPIRKGVQDLKTKVEKMEQHPLGAISEKDETIVKLKKQVEKLDPSKKRAVFIGWPDSVSVDTRIEAVGKYMQDHFSSFRYVDMGCFYSGPYNARKLTNIVWVEFASIDTAQNFNKKVVEVSIKLENGGKQILVKPARTELQKTRNYALNEAKKLITNAPESNGKSVENIWKVPDSKSRYVKVNGDVAFVQTKDDAKGFLQHRLLD